MIQVEYEAINGEKRRQHCNAIDQKTPEIFECQGPRGRAKDTFRKRDLHYGKPSRRHQSLLVRAGENREVCEEIEAIDDQLVCTRPNQTTGVTDIDNADLILQQ